MSRKPLPPPALTPMVMAAVLCDSEHTDIRQEQVPHQAQSAALFHEGSLRSAGIPGTSRPPFKALGWVADPNRSDRHLRRGRVHSIPVFWPGFGGTEMKSSPFTGTLRLYKTPPVHLRCVVPPACRRSQTGITFPKQLYSQQLLLCWHA